MKRKKQIPQPRSHKSRGTGFGMTPKAEAKKKRIPQPRSHKSRGTGLGMTTRAEAKKKQIRHRHSGDNLLRQLTAGKRGTGFGMTVAEWAIMMRGRGCSACHPEPGRLVLANGGEGSALGNLSSGIGWYRCGSFSARSAQVGLFRLMSQIFFSRRQPLISFSRAIAARTSEKNSK